METIKNNMDMKQVFKTGDGVKINENSKQTQRDLMTLSFDEAQNLSTADKMLWAESHNKGANLYHVNMQGELKEVPTAGWWY
jgi:hypothetical protein